MHNKKNYDAIVIGGGIAGLSIAYALSKRKLKTVLLERREDTALEASGNPSGMIYPLLTKNKTPESEFSIASFDFTLNTISDLYDSQHPNFTIPNLNGAFLIPQNETEIIRYKSAITANHFGDSDLTFTNDPFSLQNGFYFPKAKVISPRHLIQSLYEASKKFTTLHKFSNIRSFSYNSESNIEVDLNQLNAPLLFFCHSNSMSEFKETKWLPIRKVRGQLVILPSSKELSELPYSYLFGDYITKDLGQGSVLGASFDEYNWEEEKRDAETISFLEKAEKNLPVLSSHFKSFSNSISNLQTRVSFRSQSQDRRPIFGSLPNYEVFKNSFAKLPNPSNKQLPNIPFYKGIYLLGALGSRGLTHSLFCAEILVREALKEDNIISSELFSNFKPERFLFRNWKRGNLIDV
ncbi:MAG: FAD-dependent 5-carboxymethylaminomethyl-2-thiouridine(34) oxidoreductase MnmC [Leptospira sp.]|nr:FAD-dependent 5-carboxymethylaminomethyl-2-thiouridine(34) oxidoreductase MnmC [Leptospira sp.]